MIKLTLLILKNTMIGIVSISALLAIAGVSFINLSPQFGGKPSELSLKKMNNSPNFKDGIFINKEKTLQSTGFKWQTIPQFFTNGNNKVPDFEIPVETHKKSDFISNNNLSKITWFGHSAALVEMEGLTIFIDPMLGDVPAPHPMLGSKRFNKVHPISIDSLPTIDVILISHDHYDHLDYGTILKLKDNV